MKDKLMRMLALKQAELKAAQKRADSSEDPAELRSILDNVTGLKEEIRELEAMISEIEAEEARAAQNDDPAAADQRGGDDGKADDSDAEARAAGQDMVLGSFNQNTGAAMTEVRQSTVDKYEQRGQDLKSGKAVQISYGENAEERAVNVTGGTLVVETKYSRTAKGKFNEVSGLIDRVAAIPLNGGNSYEKSFEVSDGEGDYTAEQADYTDAEPTFDFVTIGKAKITAYAEITDEATVLPNVDYNALVSRSIRNALRKKITKQIIAGAGTANTFTGIFNAPANVMPAASVDIEISAIDADTLDTIIYGYGGDEDVEGGAVLILNKADLAAFAAVRGNDGQKLYEIDKQGNTGTITSKGGTTVEYVINSICPALSAAGTAADTLCMAYGMVDAYEMPIFSNIEVQRSDDYKFKSGQTAYRGRVWAGGNVVMYKGFSRVKKVAAV